MLDILITGASKGIGLAIKEKLEKENFVRDFSRSSGVDLLKEIPEFDCDVLILNAGIWSGTKEDMLRLNWEVPIEMFRKQVNIWQEEKRKGHVIFILSNAAYQDYGNHLYTTLKSGLLHFVRRKALQLIPHGIKVSSISPATTNTSFWSEATEDNRLKCTPIEPEEVAECVYLMIKLNSNITELIMQARSK